jgi:hypothetical protein
VSGSGDRDQHGGQVWQREWIRKNAALSSTVWGWAYVTSGGHSLRKVSLGDFITM